MALRRLLSIVIFLAFVNPRSVDNGNSLPRPQQEDACPHLLKPEGSMIQVYAINMNGTERQCCGCPAGYRVAGLCSPGERTTTYCETCPSGTYIAAMAHDRQTCTVDDLDCPEGMIKIEAGFDSPARCDCPSGQFKTNSDTCQPHSPCPPGEGVDCLGTPERDTTCRKCPSGYESQNTSAKDVCILKSKDMPSVTIPIPYHNRAETSTGAPKVYHTTEEQSATKENDTPEKTVTYVGLHLIPITLIPLIIGFLLGLGFKEYQWWQRFWSWLSHFCSCTNESDASADVTCQARGMDNRYEDDNSSDFESNKSLLHEQGSGGVMTSRAANQKFQQKNTSVASPVSPPESPPQPRSAHDHTMERLPRALKNDIRNPAENDFYRHFSTSSYNNQNEIYLGELHKNIKWTNERFCAIFQKLMETCKSDKFNPATIREYFQGIPNHHLAGIVEREMGVFTNS